MTDLKHSLDLAVFYPSTKKEYESGLLESSIVKILKNTPSNENSFDLFLFFDKSSEDNYERLLQYADSQFINKVYIKILNIKDEDNIYKPSWKTNNIQKDVKIPRLGLCSGPAISFFDSLKVLLSQFSQYKNFLLLESDIQIVQDYWFDALLKFSIENSFSIAGSKYKGTSRWHRILDYKDHLNGIAIYQNTKDLKEILNKSEAYMESAVKNGSNQLNFDIAIDEWRRKECPEGFFNDFNQLLDIDYITNACDDSDQNINKKTFLKHYPKTFLLHHKTSKNNFSYGDGDPFLLEAKASSISNKNCEEVLNFSKKFFTPSISKIGIPLFFHIPKQAGITTLGLMHCFHRFYHEKKLPCDLFSAARVSVVEKGQYIFSVFISLRSEDTKEMLSNKILKHENSNHYEINLKDFGKNLLNKFFPFSVFVYPEGVEKILDLKKVFDDKFYYFSPFTVLRDPFEKTLSEFSRGGYENKNKQENLNSFNDFISGIEQEDGWFLRRLLMIPSFQEINTKHMNTFEAISEKIHFIKMNNVQDDTDSLFKQISVVYKNIYDITPEEIPTDWFDYMVQKNESKNKFQVEKKDLDPQSLKIFEIQNELNYHFFHMFSKNKIEEIEQINNSQQKLDELRSDLIGFKINKTENNFNFEEKFNQKKETFQKYSNLKNKKNIIPMFFHVPKNGGSYVISKSEKFTCAKRAFMLREFSLDEKSMNQLFRIRHYTVIDNFGRQIFRISGFKLNFNQNDLNSKILKLVDNTNGNEFTISYENLSKDFLESIILHKVDVLPNGFRFVDEFVKLFNVNDFGFLMYTTIRDPFERAVSLYNYINSSISSHEPNHKSLGLLTFDQYISSSEAEDSWLIRNLLDLPDSEILNENVYQLFCEIFNLFRTCEVHDIDVLLDEVYKICDDLVFSDINKVHPNLNLSKFNYNKNKNSKKTDKKEVSELALSKFQERTFFDQKVFNKYSQK